MTTEKRIRREYTEDFKRGAVALVPGPHTSRPHPEHTIYPYLLRGMVLRHSNLVWSADITFVPMPVGFMCLAAIIDWYSRFVLAWRLSNTIDTPFCLDALAMALEDGTPCIFNTDQGCQFTSSDFTGQLLAEEKLSHHWHIGSGRSCAACN